MTTKISEQDLQALLTCTKPFMQHVHVVQESFNLLPDKKHYGACINYVDLMEYREEFCRELIGTVTEWVYSQTKAKAIMDTFVQQGRSALNAQSMLIQRARGKFRSRDARPINLQGQFGELLIFNFLQSLFGAVPLLRKMPITTSRGTERHGADAIHYNRKEDHHLIFLGESKCYTATYRFAVAFQDALDSLLDTYRNHREELEWYIYEDFLDDRLQEIAVQYKSGILPNVEVHLVANIVYHETSDLAKLSETQIKSDIMEIIRKRGGKLDRSAFGAIAPGVQPRINYIIMPVWELDNLVHTFQDILGS